MKRPHLQPNLPYQRYVMGQHWCIIMQSWLAHGIAGFCIIATPPSPMPHSWVCICSMFPGLHCQVVAGTIPSIAVTLSPKLLAIASQLRAASKAARAGRPRRVQQGKPMDAGRLGVLLPSEVGVSQAGTSSVFSFALHPIHRRVIKVKFIAFSTSFIYASNMPEAMFVKMTQGCTNNEIASQPDASALHRCSASGRALFDICTGVWHCLPACSAL